MTDVGFPVRFVAAFVAMAAAALVVPCPAALAQLRVENYADGEVVRYPVVLVRGTLPASAESVELANASSQRDTRTMRGLVHNGRFKVLGELVPGENRLTIRGGGASAELRLVYRPQTNPYVVRIIYMTDSTGDTRYQTPWPDDAQDYAGKLDTAAKLMQTMTAERLHDLGFGRRTFNLELDEAGKVKVHVFKGAWPAEQYYAIDDRAWWARVAREVERPFPVRTAKNVVIAAYTRFDPATRKVRGHTALGGGALGLFGSGNLFTWPSSLREAQAAFMDERRIDPTQVFSDSVGRHTVWGAASTTIGATLHELSHTFGLPHTREPHDIMTRGIDRFNRVFTFVDPPSAANRRPVVFKDDEVACFPPISAAALVTSPFLAMDAPDRGTRGQVSAGLDAAGKALVIDATRPVRYVGFDVRGDAAWHVVPKDGATRVELSLDEVAGRVGAGWRSANVRIIDDRGDVTIRSAPFGGPFVRSWRFAPEAIAWEDKSRFAELDAAGVERLIAAARQRRPASSREDFVDFSPRFARKADAAGHALRTIRCEAPRRVKLFTGSDDALRVWVNGKLVQQVLELRGAQPDAESVAVDLAEGENTLLVEVSQAGGGWGLYLRIEDDRGGRLRLTDDGTLVPAGR